MAELPSKSRPAARKRSGRARGQMAGGMLASLSASAKPKATTTSHAHNGMMSSSLMHLNQDDDSINNNKVIEQPKKEKKVNTAAAAAAPRKIPLKEERMNGTRGRQEVQTKASNTLTKNKTANVATEVDATTTTKQPAVAPLSTTDIMTTTSPRNDNPEAIQQNVVKSPYSILSPVANNDDEEDDDTLTTTPPLTSVKMKNQLHTCVLSPISLVGIPSTPAKMEEDDDVDDEDTDDDDESFAESKEEEEEHSNSSNSTSNESDESSSSSHTSSSSISHEEIAANPRSVIQRKIAKDFYGKTYVGTITGYDDSEKPVFWQVEYTDGDGEDYSYGELIQGMAYFEEKFGKDGVNLPSNYNPEESSCDYEDDEDNDEDDCFDDEETDDDEDYSIEQDSDSEDELEIDEGVDSEKKQKKNGKSRGKKGIGKKVPANDDIKSDTMSGEKSSDFTEQKSEEDLVVMLEACRVDLSTQLDDDDEAEVDNMNVDFNVSNSESSPDHITTDSDTVETEDSDPVAVEVLSEDGTSTGVNSEPSKQSTSVEMQLGASQDTIVESTMEEVTTEVKSFPTSGSTSEAEAASSKPDMVEAMVEPQGDTIVAEEAKIEVEADVAEGANDTPQQPTISELFAVVDKIFIESDTDTVTVKDVKNSVADHFGLEKVSKEMKKAIKERLTDLIQGNVQPAGAMEETQSGNFEEEQKDIMTEAAEFSIDDGTNTGDSSNIVYDESSPVGSSGEISHSGSDSLEMSCFSHDDSLANESQSNSVSTNDDQMAMSGTLFQNLSPEFSIHSRSSVNDDHDVVQMKFISSPYKANKPKSRSVVVKGKWSLGPEIGIGSFGRVHTGLNTLNGSELVFESFAAWTI